MSPDFRISSRNAETGVVQVDIVSLLGGILDVCRNNTVNNHPRQTATLAMTI